MKSMLYIGATLMAGACIYGFVDYKKTSHNKEFRSLYSEQQATKAKEEIVPKPENSIEKIQPIAETKKVETKAAAKISEKKIIEKNHRKFERKLSYKSFSRSALREFTPPKVTEKVDEEVKQE